MAEFEPAFERTVGLEGGYSKDPVDRGGETLCGISRVHHPGWPGWAMVDAHLYGKGDPETLQQFPLLQHQIKGFYIETYWQRLHLDQVESQEIADEVFDSSVNCGRHRVAKWLQHCCNLIGRSNALLLEDGIVGSKTIRIVNQLIADFTEAPLLTALKGMQFAHYHEIVLRDPTQLRFIRGWLRRV